MLPQKLPKRKAMQSLSERRKRIYDYLSKNHVGVLSTVTPDGDPHGVVIYFVVDKNFTIHVLTKTGTRKYDNLVHNNRAMLTVCDPDKRVTAQITGVATEYPDTDTINKVADIIYAKRGGSHKGLPPIMKLQAGAFTTFQIEPVQIRMALYNSTSPGSYEDLFLSVESFDLPEA